jgi:prevent-host-death family protein
MKSVSVSEARKHLDALVRQVADGEVVVITVRGRPAARLEPPLATDLASDDLRLRELERLGIVRRGRRPPSLAFLKIRAPVVEADLLGALLEERGSWR